MDQYTCPLCGGKLVPLEVETHNIPRDKWNINLGTGLLYSVIGNWMRFPHQFRMYCVTGEPVDMYTCERCGFVKAIRMKKEKK